MFDEVYWCFTLKPPFLPAYQFLSIKPKRLNIDADFLCTAGGVIDGDL